MCTEIDSFFVMWVIGGAVLGWIGGKAYKKYSAKKNIVESKAHSKPQTIGEDKDFTLKGN